jgi:hypothetical protein
MTDNSNYPHGVSDSSFDEIYETFGGPVNPMDRSLIDNIVFEDVCTWDYPDFTDAFIVSAFYDGYEMTDEQLEEINNDSQFVHDKLIENLN